MANGPASAAAHTIKIFLASPSDVESERDALSSLIREINDVLAFLVPDRELRLELLRYETHSYPDVGQAQEVINRQMPSEYDIFIGVMWKRCGTPTAISQSGTIEEFQRALGRRQQTGRPIIMFYFCDEPVPFPSGEDDLEQLTKVVRFREELTAKGYTLSYPRHNEFRDHVRAGVLRAVADLLRVRIQGTFEPAATVPVRPPVEDCEAINSLAENYDEIRRTMPSGDERTKKMDEIASAMKLHCAAVRSMLREYQASPSAGLRRAAICVLQQFPNSDELEWLAERLDPEKETPFIGYAAALALVQAARSLPAANCAELEPAVNRALSLAQRNPHDPARISVLKTALNELATKASALPGS